jgi:hypothetical protein
MQLKETPQRVKLTKLEVHNEMNSSESGIYAGASSSSSNEMMNQIETKSKKTTNNSISDEMDDEFEFKDNDFISSTLLMDC